MQLYFSDVKLSEKYPGKDARKMAYIKQKNRARVEMRRARDDGQ